MANLVSFKSRHLPSKIEKAAENENPFKEIWEYFNSLDKFTKFLMLTVIIFLFVVPFIINNYQIFNQRAQTTSLNTNNYWQGRGIEITVGDVIAVDPKNSNNVYFGYHDIGFLKSPDMGTTVKMSNAAVYGYDSNGNYPGTGTWGGNVFALAVDPDNSSIIYASNNMWTKNVGIMSKSIDNGETWITLGGGSAALNGLPNGIIKSIALDKTTPVNNKTLYVASKDNGIYKTTNDGTSWIAVNTGITQSMQAHVVTVDPKNSQVLFAGFDAVRHSANPDSIPTDLGGIYKSTNSGANWTKVAASLADSVNAIAVDPTDSNIVYGATSVSYDPVGDINNPDHPQKTYKGGIIKSTDGGNTWTQILDYSKMGVPSNHVHATSVVISPADHNTIYASFKTDGQYYDEYASFGIWKSTDGGRYMGQ